MTDLLQRTYIIVAGVDGSDASDMVIERALDLTGRRDRCELHVIRVVDVRTGGIGGGHQGQVDRAHDEAKALVSEKLEDFGHAWESRAPLAVQVHARAGDAAEEILELVRDVEADLVVIGRHGHGGRRPEIGSVPARVIAGAPCPVLVERAVEYELRQPSPEECAACIKERHDTFGEHWFCEAHDGNRTFRSTLLIGESTLPLRGIFDQ